jgi:hypothetical protein
MSAMVDGTEAAILPDEAAIAQPPEAAEPTPAEGPAVNADTGDVSLDALGIGYSDAALDMAEAEEELAALEGHTGNGAAPDAVEADTDELPDEAAPPADVPEVANSADDGDVEGDGLPVGFASADLEKADEDEELATVEPDAADPVLPGEDGPASGELVNHPSAAPTRKVKAAGLGGVLGAIPAPILSLLDLVHVSDATLGAISSALTVLGSVAAAYLARDKAA